MECLARGRAKQWLELKDWLSDGRILKYRDGVLKLVSRRSRSRLGRRGSKCDVLFLILVFLPPLSLIFTRPGFDQSLGWIFVGSNSVSSPNRPQALTISRARGFSTASSLPTILPSRRLLLTSKYTGYRHSKLAYLD